MLQFAIIIDGKTYYAKVGLNSGREKSLTCVDCSLNKETTGKLCGSPCLSFKGQVVFTDDDANSTIFDSNMDYIRK